jgi:hypothetical protein
LARSTNFELLGDARERRGRVVEGLTDSKKGVKRRKKKEGKKENKVGKTASLCTVLGNGRRNGIGVLPKQDLVWTRLLLPLPKRSWRESCKGPSS